MTYGAGQISISHNETAALATCLGDMARLELAATCLGDMARLELAATYIGRAGQPGFVPAERHERRVGGRHRVYNDCGKTERSAVRSRTLGMVFESRPGLVV
jgi:hypothetical protein